MGRVRVYELARELGMTSRELLQELEDLGIKVKSHMSFIDEETVGIILELFDQVEKEEKRPVKTKVGRRKEEKEMENRNFHRVERRYGKFSRSIAIPSSIELDKIDATYKNGVLTVKVPKSEEAKPKEIDVKIN